MASCTPRDKKKVIKTILNNQIVVKKIHFSEHYSASQAGQSIEMSAKKTVSQSDE